MDFRKAFEVGIAAHESVEAVQRELREVLSEVARQVADATQDKIELATGPRPRGISMATSVLLSAFGTEADPKVAPKTEPVVLYARAEAAHDITEALCEIESGTSGYPITFQWSGQLENCYDRRSLEVAFEKLLSHADTGRRFKTVLAKASKKLAATGPAPATSTAATASEPSGLEGDAIGEEGPKEPEKKLETKDP